jgi:integrase
MGILGAMRRDDDELTKMSIDDIKDEHSVLIVAVPDTKTDIKRTFTVTNPEYVRLYRKYAALRLKHVANRRAFYRYENGKCNAQVVGVHKIGEIPSLIAKYLGLPNSKEYTGHCYRRSSAALLANSGADISMLKRHGGWKSATVAESYVADSIENKNKISKSISGAVTSSNPTTSGVDCSKRIDLVTSSSGITVSNNVNCTINVNIYPK